MNLILHVQLSLPSLLLPLLPPLPLFPFLNRHPFLCNCLPSIIYHFILWALKKRWGWWSPSTRLCTLSGSHPINMAVPHMLLHVHYRMPINVCQSVTFLLMIYLSANTSSRATYTYVCVPEMKPAKCHRLNQMHCYLLWMREIHQIINPDMTMNSNEPFWIMNTSVAGRVGANWQPTIYSYVIKNTCDEATVLLSESIHHHFHGSIDAPEIKLKHLE